MPSEQAPARTTTDRPVPSRLGRPLRWWREVLYAVAVYVVYSAVRNLFGSAAVVPRVAYENALDVIRVQELLGLYFEPQLQRWYLDLPADGLIRVWNAFYGIAHFVVTGGALVWLYRRDPPRYPLWRNTLAFTTLLALVGFALFPLMPPRLMDDPGPYGACRVHAPRAAEAAPPGEHVVPGCDRYGFVDTIAVHGGWASFGSDQMAAVSNQYAAMPSMHIGWSTWSALVLVPLLRRRRAVALAVAYPAVTLFCIMVTANHFWLDAVGGWVCLGAGYLVARSVSYRRVPRRAVSEPVG